MPDPIDELSNFEPGVPVSPIPAAEVRRRGERLRRRRTALVVGGAVAAVLLIAVPVAVVANGDDGGTPQPASPVISEGDALTADDLPVRDRLTPWQPMAAEGQVLSCAPQLPASLDETLGYRQDFRADTAGSPADETPTSVIRSQVLQFDSPTAAREAYDQAQGWSFGCPGGDNLARKGVSVSTFELEGGQGEWRLHEFYAPDICDDGCDAIRFERMGIAQWEDRMILVSLAEVGGPQEPEGLDESMDELFQAAVTKADGEIMGASGEGVVPQPDPDQLDFPIDAELPMTGSEFSLQGPGPDIEGVSFPDTFCGSDPWSSATTRGRLAMKLSGPEYELTRELATFEAADEAALTVSAIRDAVAECPVLPADEPEADQIVLAQPVDSGYDDVTFTVTYREGLGGVAYQFVRVGHAVLATVRYGEMDPRTAPLAAEELNENNRHLTALMCEYTEDGC